MKKKQKDNYYDRIWEFDKGVDTDTPAQRKWNKKHSIFE